MERFGSDGKSGFIFDPDTNRFIRVSFSQDDMNFSLKIKVGIMIGLFVVFTALTLLFSGISFRSEVAAGIEKRFDIIEQQIEKEKP